MKCSLMRHLALQLLICLTILGPAISLEVVERKVSSTVHNANHIFNAIHSSMREWGGFWKPNGMSFFLATVPAGTKLYHGTDQSEPINGTEWLAFEPEQGLGFAKLISRGEKPGQEPPRSRQRDQRVLHDNADRKKGYLHTYSAAKDLRLLYIDGFSAGKTDLGTLDSQDRILLKDQIGSLYQDPTRAQLACQIARDDWHGRIDGFIRMEAGFEIILCDFARDLDLIRITGVELEESGGKQSAGSVSKPGDDWFLTYRAIAARFDSIGGDRVRVNYDHFVTAYTYEELDLFQGGRRQQPRLANLSFEELQPIRNDLNRLVMEHDAVEPSFHWQAVVDMVVKRYSNELKYLVSGDISSISDVHSRIKFLLAPFVDHPLRDATVEADRCATQFIPTTAPNDTLAARVVYDVSLAICSTLQTVLDQKDHRTAVATVQGLIDYLDWTTWKECRQKCGYNEVCFVPVWPMVPVEERGHPQCWGGPGFPPQYS
ncbi:hypothetical protein VTN02DRAFT_2532 [Thermoascus thermophilus]